MMLPAAPPPRTINMPAKLSISSRRHLYRRLRRSIANTPLFRLKGIEIPNNCKVYVKAEYLNPTGSHYDREMVRYLEWLELDARIIQPGKTQMLETTTGNSGAAFAWLCRVLGYPPPVIVIPSDMPRARRAQIESFGARLVESPAGAYITGIEGTFGELYRVETDKPPHDKLYCPKHWEDEQHSVAAMRECGEEILAAASEIGIDFDFFMLALGNGSSARGIGNVLRDKGVTLLGMEPEESPIVAEFLKLEGFTSPRPSSERTHGIIGTGPAEQRQVYRNMRAAAANLETIVHVATPECEAMQIRLMDEAFLHVGMSSAACVRAIQKYIMANSDSLRNRNFGTVFYDPAWKYLT